MIREARPDTLVEVRARPVHPGARCGSSTFVLSRVNKTISLVSVREALYRTYAPFKNCLLRCSTIEVHPNFSEAPFLRSSIPLPKTDFSKNQIASRRIIPLPESTIVFFSNSSLAFRRFWDQGTPSFRNKIPEICYLHRRTGLFCTLGSHEHTY